MRLIQKVLLINKSRKLRRGRCPWDRGKIPASLTSFSFLLSSKSPHQKAAQPWQGASEFCSQGGRMISCSTDQSPPDVDKEQVSKVCSRDPTCFDQAAWRFIYFFPFCSSSSLTWALKLFNFLSVPFRGIALLWWIWLMSPCPSRNTQDVIQCNAATIEWEKSRVWKNGDSTLHFHWVAEGIFHTLLTNSAFQPAIRSTLA